MNDIYRKQCLRCDRKDLLAEEWFHVDNRNKDGYAGECKRCRRERDIARRQKKRTHALAKKKNLDIQAQAYRNALLQLMNRHPEEFNRILKGQVWRLQAIHAPEEERWRPIEDVLV